MRNHSRQWPSAKTGLAARQWFQCLTRTAIAPLFRKKHLELALPGCADYHILYSLLILFYLFIHFCLSTTRYYRSWKFIANASIDGKKCIILWYVVYVKFAHVKQCVVTDMIEIIKENFDELNISMVK